MTESRSDQQLLLSYADGKSDDAFRAIVDRHAGWIFAAAFRQLGDRQLAEDAVQIVFVLLARRSDKMPTHQKLSGWLFNTLGYTVQNLRRARRRRLMHEQRAAMEMATATESSAPNSDLAIHLDAAVANLGNADRSAIVLRFYQDRSFGEIAATLGISEAAARKRVSRGTEKLRKRLEKVGVGQRGDTATLSAAAVQGLQHVPATLAESAAHVALAAKAGAAISGTILAGSKGTVYLMTAAKIKISAAIVIFGLLTISATAVVIHYAPSLLAQAAQDPSAAATTSTATIPAETTSASTRPANAADYYVLQPNQIFKRITDAPPDVRDRFLREHGHRANPRLIRHFFASTSKQGTSVVLISTDVDYPLRQLASIVCFIRQQASVEAEIGDDLADDRLSGDILFRNDCSDDECSAGLAKLLRDDFGIDAAVVYRNVPRKVIVGSGRWKFTALPQAPSSAGMAQPCIELFGNYPLDKHSKLSGSSETGRPRIARNLGDQLNEQVIIEADGLPEFMSMRSYGKIPSDTANRDLVLEHLKEQTGLDWTEETRTVTRLIIEKAAH